MSNKDARNEYEPLTDLPYTHELIRRMFPDLEGMRCPFCKSELRTAFVRMGSPIKGIVKWGMGVKSWIVNKMSMQLQFKLLFHLWDNGKPEAKDEDLGEVDKIIKLSSTARQLD